MGTLISLRNKGTRLINKTANYGLLYNLILNSYKALGKNPEILYHWLNSKKIKLYF
jgi:hypothetical protein